jgi:hypothetical protein
VRQMTDAELDDVMAYGLCWCGEPRHAVMEGYVESPDRQAKGWPPYVVELLLLCYSGHNADEEEP